MDYYYIYSLKTNLVNSTFRVLLQLIVKENKKKIIIHIGEQFATTIQEKNLQKYF